MKIEVKNDDIPNDGISNDLTRNLDNSKNEFGKKCRRLSVKNIPAGSSHADIKSMFDKDKYPYISIHIDKNIQSCKVIMKCGDDAMKFIEDHDGKPFTPRHPTQLLSISFAPCDFMLFLTHMPLNFSSDDFKKWVAAFGPVERSFLVHSAKTFKSLGMGCVEYTNKESSIKAKNKLNRSKLQCDNEEHTVQVHWLDKIPSEYCQLSSKVLMIEHLEKHLDGEASLLKIMNDTNPNYLQATKDKYTNFAVVEYDTIDLAETAWENLNETTGLKVSICVPNAQGEVVFASMKNFVEAPGGGLLPLPDVPGVGNNVVPFTVAIPQYPMLGDVNAHLQLMAPMDMQRRPFYPQHLNSVLPPPPHIPPPSHQPPPLQLLLPPPQQLQQQYYQQQLQQQQHTLTFGSSIPPQSKYYVDPYTQQQQQPYYQQLQQQHQQRQQQQQQHQQQQRQQQHQQYQQQKQQQQQYQLQQNVQTLAEMYRKGYVPHHGRKDNGDGSLAQVNTEAQRSTNVRDYGDSGTSRPQCLSRSTSLTNELTELTKKDDTKSIWNTHSQDQSPTPYCSTNVSSMWSSMENLNTEQDGIAVEPVGGHLRSSLVEAAVNRLNMECNAKYNGMERMNESRNYGPYIGMERKMNESRNLGAIGTKMVPGEGYLPINQSPNSLNCMESSRVRSIPTPKFMAYTLWPESPTWGPPVDLKTTSVAEEAVMDIEN